MMVKQTLGFPSKTRMTMKMIRKVLVTIKSSFKNLKTVRKESLNGIAKTIRGKLLRRVECKHDWRPLLVVAPWKPKISVKKKKTYLFITLHCYYCVFDSFIFVFNMPKICTPIRQLKWVMIVTFPSVWNLQNILV